MPAQLVGREDVLDVLERALCDTPARLITLTGPGGVGKTSVALAIADRMRAVYSGRVVFVDLAPVTDPDLVLTSVAHALDMPEHVSSPSVESVADWIGVRGMLLVLDNFEHLLAAACRCHQLVALNQHVQILVTSRASLRVSGEREIEIPPLPQQASMRLFLDRARVARADFQLTDANASAVNDICLRLDGLPLALELAAARIKVISAEQIATRLSDCFGIVAGGGAERPARQRTLRATLDWSYRMLDAPERALLRRMGVFSGGASIDALERVRPCDVEVLDALSGLVDHSLVSVIEQSGATRYRLLETVRQYALEQLYAAGEDAAVCDLHAAWCLEFAEVAEPELLGAQQRVWLERLEREFDNFRHAMAWLLAHGAADSAQRLAAALWKFCEVRGHAREGETWLASALDLAHGEPLTRARALHGAANLAFVRGEYERSTALHEESLSLRHAAGDRRAAGITQFHLASVLRSRGDTARALEWCRASLAVFRELDDLRWCANALNSLGMLSIDTGALSAAREALEEATALYRRLGGSRGVAIALGNLGDLERCAGEYLRADQLLFHSLELFDQLADVWGCSAALESLALVACERGSTERSAVLFGAASVRREEVGAALAPADRPVHERAVATLQLRLGVGSLESAVARGRTLSRPAAVAFARPLAGPECVAAVAVDSAGVSALTGREREVAALVTRGLSNRQIADHLVVTKHTADKHIGNILSKLGLASRAQLAVWWLAHAGAQSSYL